jgi:hypothetical protein
MAGRSCPRSLRAACRDPSLRRPTREHDLVVFDARTGRVSSTRAGVFAAYARCYLVRGGRRAFVACESPGTMKLLRIDDLTAPPVEERTLTGKMASVGRGALLITEDGGLRETLDGDETFHDVTPPPGGADPRTLSCEEGGCHVGPWLRLGWGPWSLGT